MNDPRLVADVDGVYADGDESFAINSQSIPKPLSRSTIQSRKTILSRRVPWPESRWIFAWIMVVASVLITRSAWIDMFKLAWTDDECQYVVLAPFVTAWLVWIRRWRLPYCKLWGRWVGLVIMIPGAWLWFWGYQHSAATFWYGGPVLVAAGAFISVVGADVLQKFLPAFASLMFLVPLTPTRRHIIAGPMEHYAAQWTQQCCQFFGLNVLQQGNLLTVNGTQVEVAEACSGIRQLVTFWLVSYLLAFSRPLRWYSRMLILLFVPVVAIVSNVVRLVPTVWIYSYGAGATAERFHDAAGWVMLIVAFVFIEMSVGFARWLGIPIQRFQQAGL